MEADVAAAIGLLQADGKSITVDAVKEMITLTPTRAPA